MKQQAKKLLPHVGAKRFGHSSHVHEDLMVRRLEKGGYFDKELRRERKRYKQK